MEHRYWQANGQNKTLVTCSCPGARQVKSGKFDIFAFRSIQQAQVLVVQPTTCLLDTLVFQAWMRGTYSPRRPEVKAKLTFQCVSNHFNLIWN